MSLSPAPPVTVSSESRVFLFLKKYSLLLWILLFLTLRFALLLTSIEKIYWWEELQQGAIARGILDGLRLPFLDWQAGPYAGGSFVVGIAAIPFFILFGPTLFALKLVPLLFSLASFILLFLFLGRYFGQRAANLGACFFVFSPPAFTRFSFVAMGSHEDSLFLSMGILFCFYEFLYGKNRNRLFLILFGLLSGGGTAYAYIVLITVLSCLTSWFFVDRRSFLSAGPVLFLCAFAAGFSPCVIYNAAHHYGGFSFVSDNFLDGLRSGIQSVDWKNSYGGRFVRLLLKGAPSSFDFPSFLKIPGLLFSDGYYGLMICLYFFLFREEVRNRRAGPALSNKTFLFVFYPLCFVVSYVLSGVTLMYGNFYACRYYIPLQFMGFMVMAIAFERMPRQGETQFLFIPLFLLGVLSQAALFFPRMAPPGQVFRLSGYSYYQLGFAWEQFLFPFPEKAGSFLGKAALLKKEEDRRLFYLGYIESAIGHGCKNGGASFPEEIEKRMTGQNPFYRSYFLELLGCFAAPGTPKDLPGKTAEEHFQRPEDKDYFYYGFFRTELMEENFSFPDILKQADTKLGMGKKWLFWILGQSFFYLDVPLHSAWKNTVKTLSPSEQSWVYRGMGQVRSLGGSELDMDSPWEEFPSGEIPPEYLRDYYWGFGWRFVWSSLFWKEQKDMVYFLEKKGISSLRENIILEGLNAARQWYGLEEAL